MDNTLNLIAKLNYLMNEMIGEELKKNCLDSLSTSHGTIIIELNSKETMTMGELSEKIQKSPQTVTTLVSKLVKCGYAETIKDESDKRVTHVKITTKGKNLLSEIEVISKALYETQYININDEEKENFRATLKNMINNFENR